MLPSFLMALYKQTFSLNLVVQTHVVFFFYNFVLSRMLQDAMVYHLAFSVSLPLSSIMHLRSIHQYESMWLVPLHCRIAFDCINVPDKTSFSTGKFGEVAN